jgi:hypothetical protein
MELQTRLERTDGKSEHRNEETKGSAVEENRLPCGFRTVPVDPIRSSPARKLRWSQAFWNPRWSNAHVNMFIQATVDAGLTADPESGREGPTPRPSHPRPAPSRLGLARLNGTRKVSCMNIFIHRRGRLIAIAGRRGARLPYRTYRAVRLPATHCPPRAAAPAPRTLPHGNACLPEFLCPRGNCARPLAGHAL